MNGSQERGVFGLLRYLLALMVAVAHLAPLYAVHVGFYAVFCFFTLSGYLMCLVLDTSYLNKPRGVDRYLCNRFLRIFPSYLLVLIVSWLIAIHAPQAAQYIHPRMQVPVHAGDWLDNIFIIGLTGIGGDRSVHNLVPPSWSLAVELFFWVMLPFVVRSRRVLIAWGVASMAYTAWAIAAGMGIHLRYYSYLAASLPFWLGAFLYRWEFWKRPVTPRTAYILLGFLMLYYAVSPAMWGGAILSDQDFNSARLLGIGLYVAIVLNTLVVWAFASLDRASLPGWFLTLDQRLGEWSYPIFLVHVLAGLCTYLLWPEMAISRSWPLFFLSFPILHIFAIILWYGVERNVSKVRYFIKGR